MKPVGSDQRLDDLVDRCFEALRVDPARHHPFRRARLRRELAKFLDLAASIRRSQAVPSPSRLRDAVDRIYRQSGKLLEALGTSPTASRPLDLPTDHPTYSQLRYELAAAINPNYVQGPIADGSADQAFREAIRQIRMIRAAALKSKRALQSRLKHPDDHKRHLADPLLERLIRFLMDVYLQVTAREPGASYNENSRLSGGPLIRFLEVCLSGAGWSYSAHTLRRWVSKINAEVQRPGV